jgi:hypothetical protein
VSYDDAHCRCPSCGSTDVERTYASPIQVSSDFRDTNSARCACGWSGTVHDLVGKRLIVPRRCCPMAIKSPVEIAMAHDILLAIHNGATPLAVEGENKTILAAQVDALAWVLGEKCGFGDMLANLRSQCEEEGVEFRPRGEAN